MHRTCFKCVGPRCEQGSRDPIDGVALWRRGVQGSCPRQVPNGLQAPLTLFTFWLPFEAAPPQATESESLPSKKGRRFDQSSDPRWASASWRHAEWSGHASVPAVVSGQTANRARKPLHLNILQLLAPRPVLALERYELKLLQTYRTGAFRLQMLCGCFLALPGVCYQIWRWGSSLCTIFVMHTRQCDDLMLMRIASCSFDILLQAASNQVVSRVKTGKIIGMHRHQQSHNTARHAKQSKQLRYACSKLVSDPWHGTRTSWQCWVFSPLPFCHAARPQSHAGAELCTFMALCKAAFDAMSWQLAVEGPVEPKPSTGIQRVHLRRLQAPLLRVSHHSWSCLALHRLAVDRPPTYDQPISGLHRLLCAPPLALRG